MKKKPTKKASMRGRNNRARGQQLERDVANRFKAIMPGEEIKRGLQSRGEEFADVIMPRFWPECKRTKSRPNPLGALDQAERGSLGTGLIPLAICKEDRRAATVTLYFEDFAELVEVWWQKINE